MGVGVGVGDELVVLPIHLNQFNFLTIVRWTPRMRRHIVGCVTPFFLLGSGFGRHATWREERVSS